MAERIVKKLRPGEKVRVRMDVDLPRVLKHKEALEEIQGLQMPGKIEEAHHEKDMMSKYRINFGNPQVCADVWWFEDEIKQLR